MVHILRCCALITPWHPPRRRGGRFTTSATYLTQRRAAMTAYSVHKAAPSVAASPRFAAAAVSPNPEATRVRKQRISPATPVHSMFCHGNPIEARVCARVCPALPGALSQWLRSPWLSAPTTRSQPLLAQQQPWRPRPATEWLGPRVLLRSRDGCRRCSPLRSTISSTYVWVGYVGVGGLGCSLDRWCERAGFHGAIRGLHHCVPGPHLHRVACFALVHAARAL